MHSSSASRGLVVGRFTPMLDWVGRKNRKTKCSYLGKKIYSSTESFFLRKVGYLYNLKYEHHIFHLKPFSVHKKARVSSQNEKGPPRSLSVGRLMMFILHH